MQLIRAINKSNKSNNNNNQSSSASNNNSKVVIVAPPATLSSVSQTANAGPSPAPVSPSVALPALKKRTSIVKQSVPPPVPPRGSPRSKSKLIGVSSSRRCQVKPKSTIDVDRLKSLSSLEQSGSQKVKKWLESVEMPIPEEFEFKSVKLLAESFVLKGDDAKRKTSGKGYRVSDSSFVRTRIESYDSLERFAKPAGKLRTSECGTDSGIDIPARFVPQPIDGKRKFMLAMNRFSRDGEFV